jgi:hypothetical protein
MHDKETTAERRELKLNLSKANRGKGKRHYSPGCTHCHPELAKHYQNIEDKKLDEREIRELLSKQESQTSDTR